MFTDHMIHCVHIYCVCTCSWLLGRGPWRVWAINQSVNCPLGLTVTVREEGGGGKKEREGGGGGGKREGEGGKKEREGGGGGGRGREGEGGGGRGRGREGEGGGGRRREERGREREGEGGKREREGRGRGREEGENMVVHALLSIDLTLTFGSHSKIVRGDGGEHI